MKKKWTEPKNNPHMRVLIRRVKVELPEFQEMSVDYKRNSIKPYD